MTDRDRKLLEDAMTLSEDERLDRAEQLLSSLPEDQEWLAEFERRARRGSAARAGCSPQAAAVLPVRNRVRRARAKKNGRLERDGRCAVRAEGLEPSACGLRVRCSTIELCPRLGNYVF